MNSTNRKDNNKQRIDSIKRKLNPEKDNGKDEVFLKATDKAETGSSLLKKNNNDKASLKTSITTGKDNRKAGKALKSEKVSKKDSEIKPGSAGKDTDKVEVDNVLHDILENLDCKQEKENENEKEDGDINTETKLLLQVRKESKIQVQHNVLERPKAGEEKVLESRNEAQNDKIVFIRGNETESFNGVPLLNGQPTGNYNDADYDQDQNYFEIQEFSENNVNEGNFQLEEDYNDLDFMGENENQEYEEEDLHNIDNPDLIDVDDYIDEENVVNDFFQVIQYANANIFSNSSEDYSEVERVDEGEIYDGITTESQDTSENDILRETEVGGNNVVNDFFRVLQYAHGSSLITHREAHTETVKNYDKDSEDKESNLNAVFKCCMDGGDNQAQNSEDLEMDAIHDIIVFEATAGYNGVIGGHANSNGFGDIGINFDNIEGFDEATGDYEDPELREVMKLLEAQELEESQHSSDSLTLQEIEALRMAQNFESIETDQDDLKHEKEDNKADAAEVENESTDKTQEDSQNVSQVPKPKKLMSRTEFHEQLRKVKQRMEELKRKLATEKRNLLSEPDESTSPDALADMIGQCDISDSH